MSNLNYIFPFFIVESLRPSVAFYVDKLGFEVRHIGPAEDPFWVIVGRDELVFRQPIRVDSDGLRGFELVDTDGYVLFFGRPETTILTLSSFA